MLFHPKGFNLITPQSGAEKENQNFRILRVIVNKRNVTQIRKKDRINKILTSITQLYSNPNLWLNTILLMNMLFVYLPNFMKK